eukprot:gnl/MRDRNA2_/MRDRNA2_317977_c0_seq1.p1 gnl/MRDRNA2_/MRDRNA2_317977_c0~~gnl/MRDRNA2_/MRDRNA2_317977_c0_seq1.p1  ORF type:complete len:227 (+),score=32.79 gnl/MRDRNA2_/MRDRNA2_317977_c0_seq1:23-682(+)
MDVDYPNPAEIGDESTESENEATKSRSMNLMPFDDMCRWLKHIFTMVKQIRLTNIIEHPFEDMMYRFASVRTIYLDSFGFVELKHDCAVLPVTYVLHAERDRFPHVQDNKAVVSENRSRLPQNVIYMENTKISEREGLYLAEYRNAYKNGDNFYQTHYDANDFRNSMKSSLIRKLYKNTLEKAINGLPPGWTKHWSKEFAISYYWHQETGRSVWEKPTA